MFAKCGSCGIQCRFENEEREVSGYQFKLNFIKCAGCGAVVGVMPYYDAGMVAHTNQGLLKELKERVSHLESQVAMLTQILKRK